MDTHILGVGQIGFGLHHNIAVATMAEHAVNLALIDAGLEKSDMQAVFFANSCWEPPRSARPSLRGQLVLRQMGIPGCPVINTENAAAGGGTALHLAWASLRANACDAALVIGVEKACREGDEKDSGASFGAGSRDEQALNDANGDAQESCHHAVEWDARLATWHMERFGTTREQLASITSKNRAHASLNPRAFRQRPITPSEVLQDVPAHYPFTQPMCTFPADGAAAVVICSGRFLRKLGSPRNVQVLASVLGPGVDPRADLGGTLRLASRAYEIAGVSPQDIDVAELHDVTSFGELRQAEAAGLCAPGGGGSFALEGATSLGGRVPVNTSGGLECCGTPASAVGLAQVHEVVMQLRGDAGARQVEGARHGLTQNSGGEKGAEDAVVCIHILKAPGSRP